MGRERYQIWYGYVATKLLGLSFSSFSSLGCGPYTSTIDSSRISDSIHGSFLCVSRLYLLA